MKTKEQKSDTLMGVAKAIGFITLLIWLIAIITWGVQPVNAGNYTYYNQNVSIDHGSHDAHYYVGLDYFDYWATSQVIQASSSDIIGEIHFKNVTILNDAEILEAYLVVKTGTQGNNESYPRSVTIYGVPDDITMINMSTASDLSPGYTTQNTILDISYLTPQWLEIDVTDIVQEIVDQVVWNNTGDIGFKVLGKVYSDYRSWSSFEGGNIPRLEIEYRVPTSVNGTLVSEIGQYEIYYISATQSNGTAFRWYDSTDLSNRLTTAEGTDYKTTNIDPVGNLTSAFEFDTVVSVGSDIYTLVNNPTAHNKSLFKTSDRGLTWTNVADIDSGTATSKDYHAIAYDGSGIIHIGYQLGYDTYYKNYTISTDTLGTRVMIYDGGSNSHAMRAWYDESLNTIWFTRYGGSPTASLRQATVIRKISGGSWENFTNTDDLSTGTRDSDIIWAEGKMFWIVLDYEASPSSYRLFAYELSNYSDMTSWVPIGNQSFPRYVGDPALGQATHTLNFDVGAKSTGELVVSTERGYGGDEYVFQYQWKPISLTWDEWMYNLTGFSPASQPEFHHPKMYIGSGGDLRMAIVVEQDSGYSIIDKTWNDYKTSEGTPPTTVLKATNHTVYRMGGDYKPYSSSTADIWRVFDTNCTTCPPTDFSSLEDAENWSYQQTQTGNMANIFDNFMLIIGIMGVVIMGGSIFMGIGSLQNGDISGFIFYFSAGIVIGYGLFMAWLGG